MTGIYAVGGVMPVSQEKQVTNAVVRADTNHLKETNIDLTFL